MMCVYYDVCIMMCVYYDVCIMMCVYYGVCIMMCVYYDACIMMCVYYGVQCLQVYGFVRIFTEFDLAIRVYGMYHGSTEIKQMLCYMKKGEP